MASVKENQFSSGVSQTSQGTPTPTGLPSQNHTTASELPRLSQLGTYGQIRCSQSFPGVAM